MKLKEPIEGSPAYWQESYYNQRRDRLSDVVADYLTCESTDASQFYDDLVAEVDSWIAYHQSNIDKATKLKTFLLGHADVRL
jgi:hypothetical protein